MPSRCVTCAHNWRDHARASSNAPARVLFAEEGAKDAIGWFGVIDEEDEIAEAHQGVGTIGGSLKSLNTAVHITHKIQPHATTLDNQGQMRVPRFSGR